MNLNLVSSFGWRGEIFLFGMTLGLVMYLFVLRWIMDSHLYAVGDVEVAQGVAVDVVEVVVEAVVAAAGVVVEVEVVEERMLLRSQRRNLTRSWRPIMLKPSSILHPPSSYVP